jgi:hypothetical protein
MIKCRSGKKVYLSEALAEDALIDAHSRNDYAHTGPVAVYRCDDCGYFHFTSKGTVNPKLAELLKSGKLNRAREASAWESKLKRR